MRRLLFLLLLFAPAAFPYASYSGWCEQGGVRVSVAGQTATTYTQQSYPNFTASGAGPSVTVYAAGTTNKVTLYSDNAGTALGNPFPCSETGQYSFFTAAGTNYVDLLFSGSGVTTFTRPYQGSVDPANLYYRLPATGSVLTTVQTKLNSFYEAVADFGADPTNTNVSNAAIQAMVTASHASGICGHVQGGTYKLTSSSNPVVIAGGVCLHGDGKLITQFFESATGVVTSLTVNGLYNNLSGFSFIAANGGAGATAILETPTGTSANVCGFNVYDNVQVAPYAGNTGWYKFGIHVLDTAYSDCNLDAITRSEFVTSASGGSNAGVYLDATGGTPAAHAVNGFTLTDDRFAGGSGNGIICDGCGEGSVTNPEFEGLTNGMVFQSTVNAAAYNTVRGLRGEGTTNWFTFDASSFLNSVEIPYARYPGAVNYTDASGGKNNIRIPNGTTSESMGADGLSGQFCIFCNFQSGGTAPPQSTAQFEMRPSVSTKFLHLWCVTTYSQTNGCALLDFQPQALNWLFGNAGTGASNTGVMNTWANNAAADPGSMTDYEWNGEEMGQIGCLRGTYPLPNYCSIQPGSFAAQELPIRFAATTQSSTTVLVANTTGLAATMAVWGPGIPYNDTIASLIANTSITLNVAATASASVTLTATANVETAEFPASGGLALTNSNGTLGRPACTALLPPLGTRGTIWYAYDATGTADHIQICLVTSSSAAWYTIH